MEPKLKPRSKRLIGLMPFALPSLAGRSKGLRRTLSGLRMQLTLPQFQELPPPAVEASRLKLRDPGADLTAQVEASRLKP